MDINQLIEFVTNHALLVLALVVILAMLIGGELQQRLGGVRDIGPGDATRLLNHDNAVMVDMRDDKAYRDGHIVNAIHAPDSGKNTSLLEKYRERPLIVYCRSGQQSSGVCRRLRKQGFESVYNLKGGIQGWQRADLPLSRGKQTSRTGRTG
jgi:rhodanese-related sulfurtransferase